MKQCQTQQIHLVIGREFNYNLSTPPRGVGYKEGDRMHDHDEAIRRLKVAEGHLRGVQRMLENNTYCIDVIRQIQAVQASLNKVTSHLLDQHLNSCVVTAVRGEDLSERERILKEISDVFETASRV
jgi:DNA-binding FrmR family transcriptional regulator